MIPEHMAPFPKINTLYKRDDKGRILPGEFARPEFEVLYDIDWLWTEKVDGTNIRLGFDPDGANDGTEAGISFRGNEHLWIAGRTNNAQIPPTLLKRLMEIQQTAPYEDVFDEPVTLYGEGYGASIQKGGNYNPDGVDFVLFDVKVGKWWLDYADVIEVGYELGIETVPLITLGPIHKAEVYVQEQLFGSWWDEDASISEHEKRLTFIPEGLVGRPATTLFNKAGERILCKIKHVDYDRLKQDS